MTLAHALTFCAGPAAVYGMTPPPIMARPPDAAAAKLPPAHVWLVLARRALGHERYEEALRCFDGALAHDPTIAVAHLGRASCLWQMGRDAEAHHATLALLDAAHGQEESLYHLARLAAREGRISLAAGLLQHAVSAVPTLEEKAMKDALFADHPAYLQAIGRL